MLMGQKTSTYNLVMALYTSFTQSEVNLPDEVIFLYKIINKLLLLIIVIRAK